jgi:hypothetical protein
MVWKHFWPDHYEEDRVRPWRSDDQNEEFNSFFRSHMRKMIAVRRGENGESKCSDQLRYLSKNNLNIARLNAQPSPLQEGTFVIPFRDPLQQAASMKRQHERFLQVHEEDDFVREYMEAIGHHEFGKGLKPVNFGGWLDGAPAPSQFEFWVRYWIAAYGHVLEHAGTSAVLVSYARLTAESERSLAELAERLGLPEAVLAEKGDQLRPPRTHSVDEGTLPQGLRKEASDVYRRLDERAVN